MFDKPEVLLLPEKSASSSIGGKLVNVGGKIGGKIIPGLKKIQSDKRVDLERRKQIDHAFLDRIGIHCLIVNSYGHTYYLNYNSATIRRLKKMKKYILKCVEFDQRLAPDSL